MPDLDHAVITWSATNTANYTLEYTDALPELPAAWTNVPGLADIPGPTDLPWSITVTNDGLSRFRHRYYRVRTDVP